MAPPMAIMVSCRELRRRCRCSCSGTEVEPAAAEAGVPAEVGSDMVTGDRYEPARRLDAEAAMICITLMNLSTSSTVL